MVTVKMNPKIHCNPDEYKYYLALRIIHTAPRHIEEEEDYHEWRRHYGKEDYASHKRNSKKDERVYVELRHIDEPDVIMDCSVFTNTEIKYVYYHLDIRNNNTDIFHVEMETNNPIKNSLPEIRFFEEKYNEKITKWIRIYVYTNL